MRCFRRFERFLRAEGDGRTLVMRISGVFVVALSVVALVIPAPYVVESPGPSVNILGKVQGKPVISVEGRQSYEHTTGKLDLVAVYVRGGPQSMVTAFDVFKAWMSPSQSVLPSELVYPASMSRDEVITHNEVEMVNSQDQARAAALDFLKIDYSLTLTVRDLVAGSPAAGALEPGDRLLTIDGQPIRGVSTIKQVASAAGGKAVTVEVERGGERKSVQVTPKEGPKGSYILGVNVKYTFTFPFTINFNVENIGGPSAGLMFTLSIINLLTPQDITGGKHFSGTGEIGLGGEVGPIGGIAQKMVSAQTQGADTFLAPSSNCAEVVGNIPAGLSVVKVQNLKEAYDAVTGIAAGKDPSTFPQCTAP